MLALVPFVSGPFLRLSVTAFDELSGGLFIGSLLGVGVLIAVPVLLLGMVSPYAVRLKVDQVEDAGRVAGRLYAIGTIGSLTGTFLAALLLIPVVGTHRTFLLFALVLALVARAGARPPVGRRRDRQRRDRRPARACRSAPRSPPRSTGKVIWERETEYQYARVIQRARRRAPARAQRGPRRALGLPPGQVADRRLLGRHAGAPLRRRRTRRSAWRSSAARPVRRHGRWRTTSPTCKIDAVEIDPDVTDGRPQALRPARALRSPPTPPTPGRGCRPSTRSTTRSWSTPTASPTSPSTWPPASSSTRCATTCTPVGRSPINVGPPRAVRPAREGAHARPLRASFGRRPGAGATRWTTTNTMVLGTTSRRRPRRPAARGADAAPRSVPSRTRGRGPARVPGLRGGTVYTDDRAPVEWLVDASLAQVAEAVYTELGGLTMSRWSPRTCRTPRTCGGPGWCSPPCTGRSATTPAGSTPRS